MTSNSSSSLFKSVFWAKVFALQAVSQTTKKNLKILLLMDKLWRTGREGSNSFKSLLIKSDERLMYFQALISTILLFSLVNISFAQEKLNFSSKPLDQSTELLLLPTKKINQGSGPTTPERYQKKKLPPKKVKTAESAVIEEQSIGNAKDVTVVLVPSGNQKPVADKEELKDLSKQYSTGDLKAHDRKEISNSLFGDIKLKPAVSPQTSTSISQDNLKVSESTETLVSMPISQPPAVAEKDPNPPLNSKDISNDSSMDKSVESGIILLPGADSEKIEAYVEQIHSDDVRLNKAELSIASGLIMNDAKSNYSYRQYSSSSPHITFKGNFWLSPFMGVYGSYLNSIGSDMTSNPGNNSKIVAQHELTEFGLDLRKHYGMSRKSNSLNYGIFFSEYKLTVPGDTQYRVKLRSTGIGFKVGARFPVTPHYSWTIGGQLIPRVQTIETATALNLNSGSLGESSRFGINFGGEIKLTRFNQIYWILEGFVEKNQFNGQASEVDPETGIAPRGVGVENRFLILSFGYRWGQ